LANNGSPEPNLAEMQAQLGYQFHQPALLLQALTHPSYVNESSGSGNGDNQRLEFLGDAIIDFVVGEWLYNRYPQAREGELTSLRAYLVRTESLARLARELSVGQNMRFGRGERASGGAKKEANLCAAFEAITGAIFLDSDIETVRLWLHELLAKRADDVDRHRSSRDSKSRLQELVQGRYKVTPTYAVIASEGPDHARQFTSQVLINGEAWGQGSGHSKQAAEQAAAAAALERFESEEST